MLGKSIVPPFARSEHALLRAAQQGDERAIVYLITRYEPIRRVVGSQLRRLDRSGRHHDEMRAAANLALLEALRNFDPGRGARFATYAFQYVRGAMLRARFSAPKPSSGSGAPRIEIVGLDEAATERNGNRQGYERELFAHDGSYGADVGYDRALAADRDAAVRAFVAGLVDGQREIVIDLFWRHRTHREVAVARGVSRPAVSQALARACDRGRVQLAEYQLGLSC